MSQSITPDRLEPLLKEYSEGLSNFRLLTEIRFKLLALVPVAAAAAGLLRVAVTKDASAATAAATLALSVFGLVVTLAVAAYNQRNDQLYSALVERATDIEREVGLFDGYFATRPQEWATLNVRGRRLAIGHRGAIAVIYSSTAALWLFGAIVSLLQLIWQIASGPPSRDASAAIVGSAFAGAIVLTVAAVIALKRKYTGRKDRMGQLALAAVDAVLSEGLRVGSRTPVFELACAGLLDDVVRLEPSKIRSELPRRARADLGHLEGSAVLASVRSRAQFYVELEPDERRFYMPSAPPEATAAHFVALVTDLVPRWILNMYTGRRA